MKKQIFSLLLSLCLVVGMLPTVAYANTIGGITLQDAVPGTVYLADFTSSSTTTPIPPTYNSDNRINNLLLEGTDGTIMIQGEGKAYYHDGTHGLAVFNDNCFNIAVAGDAEITFCLCAYSNGGYLRATVDEGKGVFNEESINLKGLTDGAEDTFYYTGEATTIKVTISGCTGESYLHSIKVTNKDNVTVTFNSDGGNSIDEQKVLRGQKASAPTAPTKAGYSFEGWYNGDTLYDFDTPVTENITLSAKWSASRIELTKAILESYSYRLPSGNYYLGENISVDTTIWIGDGINAADVILDLKGYELKNDTNSYSLILIWCSTRGSTATLTLMDSSLAKTGKVISSSGDAITFDVNGKLNANGGTVEGNVCPNGGNAVIDNTDPSNVTVFREGQIYSSDSSAVINGGVFYSTVDEYYGQIKGGTFYGAVNSGTIADSAKVTVTFNNDGSTVQKDKVLRGQKVTAPTEPSKAGYSFEGWYNGDTKFDFANTPVTEDITLTAKWVVGTKLTKDILDRTYMVESVGIYIYRLPSGHYYLGDDILVDNRIDIGTYSTPTQNVVLDLNGYELKKNTNSETTGVVLLCLNDSSTLTLTDSSSAKTGKVINTSGSAIAVWADSKLNANGGTIEGGVDLDDANAVIDNTDPLNITVFREGQIFGSYTNTVINGGIFYSTVDSYSGQITGGIFYGTVNCNKIRDSAKVTVSFDSDNAVQEDEVLRGQKVTAPTEPSKAGYSFNGWYNGNTAFDFTNTPVIENITLTAKWVEKSDITFNTASQSYTYDDSAQAFSITGTAVTGFDISYKQNGQTVTNPTNAGSYDVTITRAEDNTYKAVDVTISGGLVINPATPTENSAKKTTARVVRGRTLADATVTNGEFLALDGTTPLTGTFAWVDSTKVMRADGTEQMVFTPDNTNYAPITIDVAVSAYSTGGGSSTPTYAPTVTQPDNGTVTVSPKSPKKGDTVTITPTPDAGYTVEQVLVTDKNGDPVEVINNGDGTYSFTQPAGKVNINVTFMEDNSMLNFFVDVFPGDYYYDAVLWAAENGITGGVDDTHFAPNAPCTRAQIVTFLWRAAGCPEPESLTSLSDVPADAYYAKAVAWALENGITTGTGDGTTFSPNATCTRAQAMAFIYRSEQARGGGMQGAWMFLNPFDDVNLESYYGEAVMWAVANGVTDGTTATTFSPNANCTRAQIVTFLFRSTK